MNPSYTTSKIAATIILLFLLATTGTMLFAQKKPTGLKIGTYDSRIITFAWSRSDYFKQHMKIFSMQNDSAQKANDTARIKELSIQAMSFQHLLHLMIFGTGSTTIIIDIVKDKLQELAKKEGVSMIVSKYEVNFADPSVEIIDLTNLIAQLFKPTENIDKMAGEISKVQPVPLEELTIENEMLDLYCHRFAKK
ncbi:MAG: hypothetical protein NT004_07800 [Bacteroidetes bacterium]|nr:hypothetical protein [Bacteroidota bacterium]